MGLVKYNCGHILIDGNELSSLNLNKLTRFESTKHLRFNLQIMDLNQKNR